MATTTEKEETTATFRTEHGETGPFSLSDLDKVADRLRGPQLTFDVGDADGKEAPDEATVKISGSLPLGQDLKRRTPVIVQLVTQEGEVICHRLGVVTSIQFKDENQDGVVTTERIHTVKVA